MVMKLGHYRKEIRNTWRVLKCGAAEEWRSAGPIVLKMKKYYIGQGGQEYPTYNKKRKANWTGHIMCRNCLLKHMTDGKLEGRIQMTGR
jgi:hypothetical protein